MTRLELRSLLLDVLRHVQELGGHEWCDLAADVQPVGGLVGFDSITGVEATVILEERLGCTFDLDTAFVDEEHKRALNLEEIVDVLAAAMGRAGVAV